MIISGSVSPVILGLGFLTFTLSSGLLNNDSDDNDNVDIDNDDYDNSDNDSDDNDNLDHLRFRVTSWPLCPGSQPLSASSW